LLLCTVVASNGAEHSFSGFFTSPVQISTISLSSGLCSNNSSPEYYATFNYTFLTAGVRALYTFNIDHVSVVESSKAYDILNQCVGGNVWPLSVQSGSRDYVGQSGHYFMATQYTFIVSGTSAAAFGGELWNGLQGQIAPTVAGTNQTWLPLTGTTTCSQGSSQTLYDTQFVSIATDGYYNVFAAFGQNFALPSGYQVPSYTYYTILEGNYSGAHVLDTIDCTAVGTNYVTSAYGYYLNVQSFNVMLKGGSNYTFVIFADYLAQGDSFFGNYALTVTPSINLPFSTVATFTRPAVVTTNECPSPTPCQSDSSEFYASAKFNVVPNSYFWVSADQSSGDLAYYIYDGDHTGLLPVGCNPLAYKCFEDDMNGRTYLSGSSSMITIIATPWFAGGVSSGILDLYVLNGALIPAGNIGGTSTAPTNSPSAAPHSPAPSAAPQGGSSAPSRAPSAAPNNNPTTRAPSMAPTTVAPGTTAAPGTKASSAPSPKAPDVSSVGLVAPGLVTLFSLIGLWW